MSIFLDLLIYMLSFGVLIGVFFPFLLAWGGMATDNLYRIDFLIASMLIGATIGAINFVLVSFTVRPHLRLLAGRMRSVEAQLNETNRLNRWRATYGESDDFIEERSKDEVGESAQSFNALLQALIRSYNANAALGNLSMALSISGELSEVAESVLSVVVDHTRSQAGHLLLEQQGKLNSIATYRLQCISNLITDPFILHRLDTFSSGLVDVTEELTCEYWDGIDGVYDALLVPIRYKGTLQGVLLLARQSDHYTEEDRALIALFIQTLGLALSNIKIHEDLQEKAAKDELTGLYNRRLGLERFREEYQRARRSGAPLSVMMLDLDYFKQINDNFGHLVGDKVLATVSDVLKRAVRSEDILIRYGGEEIMLVLPNSNPASALLTAERLRALIEDIDLRAPTGERVKITASIGVTSCTSLKGVDDTQLIKSADDALYQAKASGRNSVMLA